MLKKKVLINLSQQIRQSKFELLYTSLKIHLSLIYIQKKGSRVMILYSNATKSELTTI